LILLTRGPWPGQSRGRWFDRPKPGEGVGDGEGEAGEIKEETEPHPMMVFLGLGVAGLEVPRGEVRRRRRDLVGEIAPTGSGRRGGVVELLEIDAKLMEGLD